MTVWEALKGVGEELQRDAEEVRRAVFENGIVPEGRKKAKELRIEGDGVLVRLQRSEKRHAEVKHFVTYGGKEEMRPGRIALQDRLVVSGIGEGRKMLEEVSAKVGIEWKLEHTQEDLLWKRRGVVGKGSPGVFSWSCVCA